jgi:uncharacterized phage protein (TIGR01671 family)
MKREIKFRVFCKRSGHYIIPWKGTGYDDVDLTYTNDSNWYILGGHQMDDNYVLEQYTGCKDKNGKEIYEGDIVDYNAPRPAMYGDDIASILWDNGWCIKQRQGKWCWSIKTDWTSERVAVIGNIYENPELLLT